MAASHIIRIVRTDTKEEGACVLGEVTPSAGSSKPLNVKIVATEGEEPYAVKLRHDRIGELQVSNSPCSPEEWEAILKAILVRGEPVDGIEAGAEIKPGKSIAITVRRRVAGINQRLGTLTLNHKPDEDIQLFDWCAAAALEREKFQESMAAELAKAAELESRMTELRQQLEELIAAKKARETEMLEKFCQLLNEKKAKIREQQRALGRAPTGGPVAAAAARQASQQVKVEDDEVEEEPEAHVPAPSRRAKRKALEDASGGGESSDPMDVDSEPPAGTVATAADVDKEDESERVTSADEDATESDPDGNEEDEPSPPPTRSRQQHRSKPAAPSPKGKGVAMHTRQKQHAKSRESYVEGSETESDDEL